MGGRAGSGCAGERSKRPFGGRPDPGPAALLGLSVALGALAVGAWPARAEDPPGPGGMRPPPVLEAPADELGAEDLERYWKTATDIERSALTEEDGRDLAQLARDLEHASDLFARVAEAPGGRPEGYWRAARAVWLAGEVLPLEEKAAKLYDYIDESPLFRGTADRDSRSLMNVTFVTGNEALDQRFIAFAQERGLDGLKGHRIVGGMRASIYNAFPEAGCEALANFMREFERTRG